jgi:hypothetical protein
MQPKSIFLLLVFTFSQQMYGQLFSYKQERPKSKKNSYLAPNQSITNHNLAVKQKVDKLAEKIIATCELNDADAKSIHDLCEDRAKKIESIKLNNDNSQQKLVDLQAVNNDFDSKLKHMLSANQYQKYETMRKIVN